MLRTVLSVLLLALLLDSAAAQTLPGARRGGSNANKPIEIASDNLEVLQDKQVAIFRGSVDVVQGDMRMRADELQVFYRDRNAQAPAGQRPAAPRPAVPPPAAGTPDMGAITRLEAKGRVFLSSPEEQAQGDLATYDVEKKIVILTGNVLLTKDKNVLKCEKVTMYQETGRSVCDAGPNQRVRGVFQSGAQ